MITVTEKNEGGWYKGLLNNKEALFPPTYCEELPPRRVMNVDTKKTSPNILTLFYLIFLHSLSYFIILFNLPMGICDSFYLHLYYYGPTTMYTFAPHLLCYPYYLSYYSAFHFSSSSFFSFFTLTLL